jgi:hypothetical protein
LFYINGTFTVNGAVYEVAYLLEPRDRAALGNKCACGQLLAVVDAWILGFEHLKLLVSGFIALAVWVWLCFGFLAGALTVGALGFHPVPI